MIDQATIKGYHRKKLAQLIYEVSEVSGGNTNDFLNEYIAEVLNTWENDLVAAIAVFEDLKTQASKLASKDAKSDVTSKDGTFRGHAAFREFYEQLEIRRRAANRERMVAEG